MGLTERKLTDWTQPVSSLDDRPQMTASALKAAFDSNTNQIKPALNGVIDDLTGTGGAGNVGVEAITGVTGVSVQAMLASLKALIDLCDTTEEIDGKLDLKADKTTTDKLVKTITLDAGTGVFTIKTDDGTTTTIDTMLEKIPVSCYLDGQEFVLVLDDGTEQRADLSAFLTPTEFTDSPTIDFSVSGDTVTAVIKAGSVTLEMLESTVMATLESYKTAAEKAAANAAASETNAGAYRDQAQQSASAAASSASGAGANATLSESWAVGGTGTREGEDVNNAKYYAQQSAASATTAGQKADAAMEHADSAETSQKAAEAAAARAEQAAEDAEAIVGGDFIPNSQKGAPGGVATLGADGKVEPEQLPAALGADAVTVSGGGELDMAESLGDGPYVIEFTEETSSGGSGGMTEEEADARYLKLAGGTLTGAVDMGGNAVTNLPAPVNDGDAARKADVEAVDNNLTAHTGDTNNPHAVTAAQVGALPLSGGVMTGPITGIVTPTASDMPASKRYVDSKTGSAANIVYSSDLPTGEKLQMDLNSIKGKVYSLYQIFAYTLADGNLSCGFFWWFTNQNGTNPYFVYLYRGSSLGIAASTPNITVANNTGSQVKVVVKEVYDYV
ncbi:MAG: hypothetical protein KH195_11810 [Clostridiaceae bacterium]|nr:hypothetical protein [Clostridiaceae bacterium]